MPTTIATALELGPIGLGCMSMSHAYTPRERDDGESIRVIRRAVELGVRLFDTADVYGPWSNEELLGRAVRGLRDDVVLATKGGLVPHTGGRLSRDGSPAHIRRACEASLRRFGTDIIDVYQLHRVDPAVPVEETWGAMAELVTEGKVRALGISHGTVEELERAHAVHPVAVAQYELSVWAAYTCTDVLPWCAENGAAFLAFSPLGRGYLTGGLAGTAFGDDDSRCRDPRFTTEAMAANRGIVATLAAVARGHGVSQAQVALAWVRSRGEHVHPIPGTKKVRYLEENWAARTLRLSPDDLARLDALPVPRGHRRWS